MKLGVSHQTPDMLTPGRLAYLRQMGARQVEVRAPSDWCTYENLAAIRDRVENAGLELFEVMRSDAYNCEPIAVGLASRDAEMERMKREKQSDQRCIFPMSEANVVYCFVR